MYLNLFGVGRILFLVTKFFTVRYGFVTLLNVYATIFLINGYSDSCEMSQELPMSAALGRPGFAEWFIMNGISDVFKLPFH